MNPDLVRSAPSPDVVRAGVAAAVSASATDLLPHVVWTYGEGGELDHLNARWYQLTGLPAGTLPAAGDLAAVVHPDDLERARELFERPRRSGEECTLELRFKHRTAGEHAYRCYLVRVLPLPQDGKGMNWIATATDIHDVKRAADLRETNFRDISDLLPQMVFTTTPEGRVDWCNARFSSYIGFDPWADPEQGFSVVVHPDDRAMVQAEWARSLRDGRPFDAECRLRAADGGYHWFLSRALPLRDPSGAIVKWYGSNTYIDDRRRADDALRLLAQAGDALGDSPDIEAALKQIAEIAVTTGFADWGSAYLAGPDGRLRVVAMVHKDPAKVAYALDMQARFPVSERSATVRAFRERRTILMERSSPQAYYNAARDPQHRALLQQLNLHSFIIVPLLMRGQAVGVLSLYNAETLRAFSEADTTVAEILAKRAAIAIDNSRLFAEREAASLRVRLLAEASAALTESLDVKTTLERLLQLLAHSVGEFAAVSLFGEDGTLRIAALAHRDPEAHALSKQYEGARAVRPEFERYCCDFIESLPAAGIEPAASAKLEAALRPYMLPLVRELGLRSTMVVPLRSRGRTLGVLSTHWCAGGGPYEPGDVPFFEEIGRRTAIAIENAASYERERRVAATFQRASLPERLPEDGEAHFAAVYSPGSTDAEIGGDWYDAFRLGDGRYMVSIGDVTGRGLGAAVIMGKVRQAIRTLALHVHEPAQLLDDVDEVLRQGNADSIVTALVGVIDARARTLTLSGAGHPPPILRPAGGGAIELPCEGLPLGLRTRGEAVTRTHAIPPDAMLVFYTDGLIESKHDLFLGAARLEKALGLEALSYVSNPARLIQESVLYDGSPDDVAILTVTIGRADHWSFEAEDAKAAQYARHDFLRYLRDEAQPGADLNAAETLFGELIGNVVRHAPGAVDMAAVWNGAAVTLHVIDRGPGFSRKVALPRDVMSESGRGLFLIDCVARSFAVTNLPGRGAHAKAVFDLPRKARIAR